MNSFLNYLAKLLKVKSLITIILTIAFVVQTCRGELDKDFVAMYTMVMTFYFVNQTSAANKTGGDDE